MRYAFIQQERSHHALGLLCRMMQVSRSGFYAWRRRPKSQRTNQDELLTQQIRAIHKDNRGIYGAPRVHAELREQQVRCSRKRVARLMRLAGLRGKHKGSTKPRRRRSSSPTASNLLAAGITATQQDRVWLSDITYLRTAEGWLYLAVVLDAFSRRVVGWAMRERLTSALALDAFNMAYCQRKPLSGLILHSDRGSQYSSGTFRAALRGTGTVPSMGGSGLDNAVAESFFATLKTEAVPWESYPSRDVARLHLFDYLERFYNRQRRHSSLGYLSPAGFEELQEMLN